ncbi:serine hydrolase [Bacteroidota bacterium]
MNRFIIIIIFLTITGYFACHQSSVNHIETFLNKIPDDFDPIIKDPEKYRLQIIYTKIDRTDMNEPVLSTYSYRVNDLEYFYPASTVKMPVSFLALEKINELDVPGLDKYTTMLTDSSYTGQSRVMVDTTSEIGLPSVGHYIRRIFLVSDNDAFNRLYEFVGQREINDNLSKKDFTGSRITHRLSTPLSRDENAHTNPVNFYIDDDLLYTQPEIVNSITYRSKFRVFAGKKNMVNGVVENSPREFTYSNFIPLDELHDLLVSVIFPESLPESGRFNLTDKDYRFLYQYMSQYPSETSYPEYGDEYADNYVKFFLFGNHKGSLPENIRIFNKVGEAYGFLTDVAYIIDFENKIEFFLAATIYVNENEIVNDGVYDYDSIGIPFMHALGEVVYNYEMKRERKNAPDLTKFMVNYDKAEH